MRRPTAGSALSATRAHARPAAARDPSAARMRPARPRVEADGRRGRGTDWTRAGRAGRAGTAARPRCPRRRQSPRPEVGSVTAVLP